MNILHVCAEFFPLLKTGGLADVTGALPKAQNKQGHDARILIPGFPAIKSGINNSNIVACVDSFAGPFTLCFGYYDDIGIYMIDAPHLYEREGSPYHDCYLNAYGDNYLRFALLSWVGAEIACGMDTFWRPTILHSHDWHAGLVPAYLKAKMPYHQAKSVFTIHNLAYPGCFEQKVFSQLQLPNDFLQIAGLEFYGQISYLKAGIYYADHITTVSPTYAKEITTDELGYGFAGLLREKQAQQKLSGILNGIDEHVWDPRTDPLISNHYNKRNLCSKQGNKFALQSEFNLAINNEQPLFAVVSRLTHQKGLDLVLSVLPTILARGGQFILLGSGDNDLQVAFSQFREHSTYNQQVAIYYGYNEALSHRITAGADIMLVPSRFEPCGLTQLYALKYGTLPLVRATGGLADTVIDSNEENILNKSSTGFSFIDCHAQALLQSINRAFELWHEPKLWRQLQQRAMSQCYNWDKSATAYLSLYTQLS